MYSLFEGSSAGGTMKRTDKNIIMITAGGVGNRFGANTPKQYLLLGGKPVISYVIDACKKSRYCDSVLVVADPYYHEEIRTLYGVDVTQGGKELNNSKRNGLEYIKKHCSCEKLIIADAVRPTVTSVVLDKLFLLLDEYDAAACARHITDSLGCYSRWTVDRADYYTLNAPEAFRFNLIYDHFDPESKLTESLQQLPKESRIYLDFDVPYFDKITYPEDLVKAEAIIGRK